MRVGEIKFPTRLPPGCKVVGYADDTLVLAGGKDWGETARAANLAVACVVRAIHGFIHGSSGGASKNWRFTCIGEGVLLSRKRPMS